MSLINDIIFLSHRLADEYDYEEEIQPVLERVLAALPPQPDTFICPDCSCENVWEKRWVHINTDEIGEPLRLEEYYCSGCETTHERLDTKPQEAE